MHPPRIAYNGLDHFRMPSALGCVPGQSLADIRVWTMVPPSNESIETMDVDTEQQAQDARAAAHDEYVGRLHSFLPRADIRRLNHVAIFMHLHNIAAAQLIEEHEAVGGQAPADLRPISLDEAHDAMFRETPGRREVPVRQFDMVHGVNMRGINPHAHYLSISTIDGRFGKGTTQAAVEAAIVDKTLGRETIVYGRPSAQAEDNTAPLEDKAAAIARLFTGEVPTVPEGYDPDAALQIGKAEFRDRFDGETGSLDVSGLEGDVVVWALQGALARRYNQAGDESVQPLTLNQIRDRMCLLVDGQYVRAQGVHKIGVLLSPDHHQYLDPQCDQIDATWYNQQYSGVVHEAFDMLFAALAIERGVTVDDLEPVEQAPAPEAAEGTLSADTESGVERAQALGEVATGAVGARPKDYFEFWQRVETPVIGQFITSCLIAMAFRPGILVDFARVHGLHKPPVTRSSRYDGSWPEQAA